MATSKKCSCEGVLRELKSDDPRRRDDAIAALRKESVEHAKGRLGAKQDNVHCQAESVVQSVFTDELGSGPGAFENDAHVEGRLKLAVYHKALDRQKGLKARSPQVSQLPDGAVPDPAARGPGVATQVVALDHSLELSKSELRARLTEGLDATDQQLVDLCVLGDFTSTAAAKKVALTPDAVRQRLSRLRRDPKLQLRERLLEPIRERVSEPDWVLLKAYLVQQQPADNLLGKPARELKNRFAQLVKDDVRPILGESGMAALERLLGRTKKDRGQHA